ncbi:hypothetical protein GCM10027348_31660 [Hymenobacter tenuis]
MASGSTQYSYVNKLRAGGGGSLTSAASRRSPQRTPTVFRTTGAGAVREDAPF